MRYETQTVRIGEDVGPVDWSHPIAADKPEHWHDAEQHPENYTYGEWGHTIIRLCMYDGWPYWKPTPAILYIGPLSSGEWAFFNNYGASIHPRAALAGRAGE